eukprot:778478-Rhodomonas_salina.1
MGPSGTGVQGIEHLGSTCTCAQPPNPPEHLLPSGGKNPARTLASMVSRKTTQSPWSSKTRRPARNQTQAPTCLVPTVLGLCRLSSDFSLHWIRTAAGSRLLLRHPLSSLPHPPLYPALAPRSHRTEPRGRGEGPT